MINGSDEAIIEQYFTICATFACSPSSTKEVPAEKVVPAISDSIRISFKINCNGYSFLELNRIIGQKYQFHRVTEIYKIITTITGLERGNMIFINNFQLEHPSIVADSRRTPGIEVAKKVRQIIMLYAFAAPAINIIHLVFSKPSRLMTR